MNEKFKVLVVEDETDVRDLILLHLRRDGLETTAVENGEEALRLLRENPFHLVILDWMLPGLSGLEICKRIRHQGAAGIASDLPILMVTARADTTDIVLGLEMGADDYITKPFELPIFLARVRALLRRAQTKHDASVRQFQVGELALDIETHQVFCSGRELELTLSEFKLLSALMHNQGRVLSRERLIDLVQGQGVVVIDRAIDTHIFGLRKKLGDCADIVETIRGVGYRVRA
ncbi:response regulator transcription factor [Bdellovibrionota bacterium FG-1]